MLTRRELLARATRAGAAAALWPGACARVPRNEAAGDGVWLNDIHSKLNRTRVLAVEKPSSVEALADVVRRAAREGRVVSIAGGRHAMGGQQFGADTVHVDTGDLDAILELDATRCAAAAMRTWNSSASSLAVTACSASLPPCACAWRRDARSNVFDVTGTEGLAGRFAQRIADGYLFRDFQYSTDLDSGTLLRHGVFS